MMRFVVIDSATGGILRTGQCSENAIYLQNRPGELALIDEHPDTNGDVHCWDTSSLERRDKTPEERVPLSPEPVTDEALVRRRMAEIQERDLRQRAIEELTKEGKIKGNDLNGSSSAPAK